MAPANWKHSWQLQIVYLLYLDKKYCDEATKKFRV